MVTSKQLVRDVFEAADLPRTPFIPWVFTHAARLEQIPVRRMYTDPTQYTKCLQNAQKLYGYDAIISSFDSSLEMELCGCPISWQGDYETPIARPLPGFDLSRLKDINVENAVKTGRFGTVTESLRRINKVTGHNVGLMATVSGPLTLLAGLTGRDFFNDFAEKPEDTLKAVEAAIEFLLKVIQTYCQLEPDVVAVIEKPIEFCSPGQLSYLQSFLSPLINTIKFYNASSILLPGDVSPHNITGLIDLGFDGIVAPGMDIKTWHEMKGERSCVFGKAIPVSLFKSSSSKLEAYLETILSEITGPGVFLTTDWELPPGTPPDNIHLLMNMISKH